MKASIYFLFFLYSTLLSILLLAASPTVHFPPATPVSATATIQIEKSERLENLYIMYNALYFRRKLPKISVVFGPAKDNGEENVGLTYSCGNYLCIEINPELNPTHAEQAATLLHEMIHVKLWGNEKIRRSHGSLFRAELHRLMFEGAFDDLL